jgi:SNF2 family DNA or RNA helicase
MTHFVESAKAVAYELGVDYIVGDVSQEERETTLARWKSGETQFLVGTIGTLGTGLNLAEAYTLVFYDQVYDPIQMRQAKDRIHRITTDHPVQAIYLVVEGTTNEIVYESFSENLSRMELVKRFVEHINKEVHHG